MAEELDLSNPEQVVNRSKDLLVLVRDAIDSGVFLADTLPNGHSKNPWLWAHMVRAEARRIIAITPTNRVVSYNLPNSGIKLADNNLYYRVLMAQNGFPPPPGISTARQAFYLQNVDDSFQQLAFLSQPLASIPQSVNLIVGWTIDQRRQPVMSLSKPKGIWVYGQNPKLEWHIKLKIDDGPDGPRFSGSDATNDDIDIRSAFDLSELEEIEITNDW